MLYSTQEYLDNILDVIGDEWIEPKSVTIGICSFDLFFLAKLAEYVNAKNITEFGCGATTIELCRFGFNVTAFSLDISPPIKAENIDIDFVQCDVMDEDYLEQIIESVKQSQLLVIDCCHSAEMAKYYSTNILPYANCLVWIHDYFNEPKSKYVPHREQKYLDREVIDKSYRRWALTDLPIEHLEAISEQIEFDIVGQRHVRPLHRNFGPKLCSVVLEKIR